MGKDININHWIFEHYAERMPSKKWRDILINNDETIIFKGRLRKLVAKKIFADIVEISKKPLKEEHENTN